MERIAKFHKVSYEQFEGDWKDTFGPIETEEIKRIYEGIRLPARATAGSAGYDFYTPVAVTIRPGEIVKIPTGIRAEMNEGWQEYKGRGISYCATCDANFFTDLEVYVAGGGDAAVEEALYLTKFARKVTIIHRRDELRAAKSIQEKAFANSKIAFLWDSVVEEVGGDGLLQTMTVKNVKTGELIKIEADPKDGLFGLFGFIGMIPNTGVFADKVETDDKGYIKTDEDMHTNVPGVYAAGDVRVKSLRQVVTAVADGAIAAVQVERSMSDY